MNKGIVRLTIALLALSGLAACQSNPPMETVEEVDLERFMGDWYVIAHIPAFLEDEAYNAIENYRLDDDGTIATTYTFRKGGFDGPEKEYKPRGFVQSENNAEWGMRFVWPFKGEYLIIYLDEDYQQTIIGRSARDYVWIMAREPQIAEEDYQSLRRFIQERGYDLEELRKVPQAW